MPPKSTTQTDHGSDSELLLLTTPTNLEAQRKKVDYTQAMALLALLSIALNSSPPDEPTSRFIGLDALVIDEGHYAELAGGCLYVSHSDGRILSISRLAWDRDKPLEDRSYPVLTSELGEEGPRLVDSKTGQGGLVVSVVANVELGFVYNRIDTSARASLNSNQIELEIRLKNDITKQSFAIAPENALEGVSLDSFAKEVIVNRFTKKPYVVTVTGMVKDTPTGSGQSYDVFVLKDSIAQKVQAPERFAEVSYVDDNYILGTVTNDALIDWPVPSPPFIAAAKSPFICKISDLSTTLLKKVKKPLVNLPGETKKEPGSIGVVPRTIDSTGTIILCDRYQWTQPARFHRLPDELLERPKYRRNVVLFRNGQAELIEKLTVEGQTVWPTHVQSAKGSFAIMRGINQKGEDVAFTYHLK